ncbi:hypothetical protein [Streptomyces sp. NPDC093568]|uniref:hypothetical protein n=1 Tax=Streptomyces sp. NPDC093568 TaxID=3366041 RepID=UPI0037FE63D4
MEQVLEECGDKFARRQDAVPHDAAVARSAAVDAEADRAFIKHVLGFTHLDAGHGRLSFKPPPDEVAVHPTDGAPKHEFHLMCDALDAVRAQVAERGAEITGEVTEERSGRLTAVRLPSGSELPQLGKPVVGLIECRGMVEVGYRGIKAPRSRWGSPRPAIAHA